MAFTRSAIAVSGLQCKSMGGSIGGTAAARVAAVFRYVPQWEHQPMAAKRTGLSSTTLSAEGVWIPSTGRTHMVACLGVGKEACHYRVTLSVQTTVSMTRRGIVAGQITAMDGRSHPPLLFQKRVCRFAGYVTSRRRTSYIYTKVDQARELLGASKPTGFRDSFVAKSLLSYPSVHAGAVALPMLPLLTLGVSPTSPTSLIFAMNAWVSCRQLCQNGSIGRSLNSRYSLPAPSLDEATLPKSSVGLVCGSSNY